MRLAPRNAGETGQRHRPTTVDALIELLGALGHVPSDEGTAMTELDHGLQCAFELSLARPDDAELHVAGLVHDIGHQFAGDAEHGQAGADVLRPLLGTRVAGLVEAHVPAKRYLAAVEPAHSLSAVSVESLVRQGGPFTPAEVATFRARPDAEDAVTLRVADDRAKVPGRDVPRLDAWLPVVRRVARRAGLT